MGSANIKTLNINPYEYLTKALEPDCKGSGALSYESLY